MSSAGAHGLALRRAADAMLRTLGGCEVALRFPVVLSSSGNARLAMAAITFEDVLVSPVVVRSSSTRNTVQLEFVIPASAVSSVLEQRQTDPDTLFRSATGIIYQDKSFRVTDVATDSYAGAAYMYRVSACE